FPACLGERDDCFLCDSFARRHRFRILPGTEGGQAESDRGIAIRIDGRRVSILGYPKSEPVQTRLRMEFRKNAAGRHLRTRSHSPLAAKRRSSGWRSYGPHTDKLNVNQPLDHYLRALTPRSSTN